MFHFREDLRKEQIAAYIPDVTDISKWVNGRENSDAIAMGLAGVSLIFDVTLLAGATMENRLMIQVSGYWGCLDCIADAVIGFLSANYTVPTLSKEEKTETHSQKGKRAGARRRLAKPLLMQNEEGGGGGGGGKRTKTTKSEKTTVGFREPEPSVAKQFLHFGWVILRLIIKSQLLCALFEYENFLLRRDTMRNKPGVLVSGMTTGF